MPRSTAIELRTLVAFLAIVVTLWIAWQVADVLFLIFAGIIVAILLDSIAVLVQKPLPFLRHPWHIIVATVLTLGGVSAVLFMFGIQAIADVARLVSRLPMMLGQVGDLIGISGLGRNLDAIGETMLTNGALSGIAFYTTSVVGAAGAIFIVVFIGIFLALDSHRYHAGMLALVPQRHRPKARQVLDKTGRGLKLWLLGQLAAMAVVGVATTTGLLLLGAPSAIPLGILAALLEFIPFVGPIAAFVVALVIVLPEGGTMALWVTLLYLGIQQIESNLLVPLIQNRTVELPPALGLVGLIVLGALFGFLGLFFAVPLTVVILIAVKQLYVRDVLGEDTRMPGEKRPTEQDDETEPDPGADTARQERAAET